MRVRFTRRGFVGATLAVSVVPAALRGAPTVFPTGTTIYDPATAWNGFTVLSITSTAGVSSVESTVKPLHALTGS